jgi:RNA polymerase sigma-70 factor (ECF subfamily)
MTHDNFSRKTDEELMLLYQQGDVPAFEVLYQRHSGKIFNYLKKRLGDEVWTDDVFQLVFAKLHQTRSQYNPSYRFDQWVFVMTKTVLLDFWKTTGAKTKRYFSESLDHLSSAQQPIAESNYIEAPSLSEALTAGLSFEQQSAVELKFIDELSYQEISKKLNRSEQNIRQLISRALKKIRKGGA